MQRCKARDLYPLSSSRQVTREGFLVAPAKINRTGIQVYLARELGLDGGDRPVRLYRPAEEVFRKETLDSFESCTATDDHPADDVNSENWALLAKGDVRDVCADGEDTSARIIVRDEVQKRKVKDGKAELSCGYSFDLDMTPGTTARGERYDGVQRNIIGNHVAIVDRGRAGFGVRIADRQPEREKTMKTQRLSIAPLKIGDKVAVPGFSFDIDLDDAAHVAVRDASDRHSNALAELKDAHMGVCDERDFHMKRGDGLAAKLRDMAKTAKSDADGDGDGDEDDDDDGDGKDGKKGKDAVSASDARTVARVAKLIADQAAEIKRLEALVTPAAIEKLGEQRATVVADALVVGGKKLTHKGKTIAEIRVAALDVALKTDGLKGIAKAVLGTGEPAKATEELQARALDAVKAAIEAGAGGGDRRVDLGDQDDGDGQDGGLSRALLGRDAEGADDDDDRGDRVDGRDSAASYWAREAEMSRRPAGNRRTAADSANEERQ